jgi:steroid delta-isomerase-like uncharacterized protein
MNRRIVGFHQDEFGDWVADLECTHSQHVRHHPPFQLRPWATTAEGRQSRIGAELACKKCDDEPPHLRENRNLVRRYYQDLWNAWNLSVADDILAEDFRFRGSLGLETCGRSGFIGYVRTIRQAFPDFHNQIVQIIAEDNRVVARLNYSGTHRGRIFEIDATGRRFSYDGVAIFASGGGQLISGWVLGDRCALLDQLTRADRT